ncbi:ATPase domain-containing protein [Telmatobacter sp. DSM 110680]|uniref:Protein RecA n=1 Tax=Telmatobacter sp. DSM 110680 TaxID=3036704 RepID=A0AAU7DEJ9_9BACT
MPSSAAIRQQIESDFQHRYPSALTPAARTIRETAATGITEIDNLLNGGLPVGAISEITGRVSSGRTTIALSFLARRTQDGNVCAWIDANDALDPESAAANGISLKHLLWVRCRTSIVGKSSPAIQHSHNEINQHWTRLDQSILASDLLLQAGGFAAIVLDLADEAIEHGSRIPLATWFRFKQAADRTRCSLVVLGKTAYAQSSAAVVLECLPGRMDTASGTVVRGYSYSARLGRERLSPLASLNRKPSATSWSSQAPWDREKRA